METIITDNMKTKEWLKTEAGQKFRREFSRLFQRLNKMEKDAGRISREVTPLTEKDYGIRPEPDFFANDFLYDYADKLFPDTPPESIDLFEAVKAYCKEIRAGYYKPPIPAGAEKRPTTHRARGIALILAFKDGKIDEDVWYTNKLKTEAERRFNIKDGHWPNRHAKNWLHYLERCKEVYPEDYQNGVDLYKTIF